MKRYVDVDKLGIGKADRTVFNIPEYADGWNSAIEIIENAPTADVVEVKRGEWREIIEPIPWCDDDVDIYYECSLCHSTEGWKTFNFCPNCGAEMRKEEENDL